MSLRYCHTLIPRSKEFIPSPAQVTAFVCAVIDRGVMGGEPALVLRAPSRRTREGINPFTFKKEVYPTSDRKKLKSASQLPGALAKLRDYDVEVSGIGKPKLPPLPIDFKEDYYVAIVCRLSSTLRSTSNLHEDSESTRKVASYGKPFEGDSGCGYFTNPHTTEVIEVPHAGCAHFWVEFELGKFLFPPISKGSLELLDPTVVAEAQRVLATNFVQGCNWG